MWISAKYTQLDMLKVRGEDNSYCHWLYKKYFILSTFHVIENPFLVMKVYQWLIYCLKKAWNKSIWPPLYWQRAPTLLSIHLSSYLPSPLDGDCSCCISAVTLKATTQITIWYHSHYLLLNLFCLSFVHTPFGHQNVDLRKIKTGWVATNPVFFVFRRVLGTWGRERGDGKAEQRAIGWV